MSTATLPARRTDSLPTRFHCWVEESTSWREPGLTRAVRLASSRAGATTDHGRPALVAPTRRTTVSVVVPCYNYGRFLGDSVGSVLRQEGCDVEVIVVDDASTDDSAEVADRMAAADDRVRVVRNEHNLGHVRTFNRGYQEVTGDVVVRLDADDLLTPGSLSRALAVMEAHPTVGLVYGHPRHFTTPEPPTPRTGRVRWTVWPGQEWVRERCRRGVNCLTTPEVAMRASVLREVGPLDTSLRFAQDMEQCLRVAAVSDVARIDEVDQALHRDHDASMSVNEGSGELTDLVERRQVFTRLMASVGDRLEAAAELEPTWRRSLAEEALRQATYAWHRGRDDEETFVAKRSFSLATCGSADLASSWERLDRRRHGPRPHPFLSTAHVARRRVADELAYLRWTRTGL